MPVKEVPDNVIEYNGMLWKPKRSATATGNEFISAQTTFKEILEEGRWNPWVRDDRAEEYDQAIEVMDQCRRAEPGHRMLTMKQFEARWAKRDRERARAREKINAERGARKARYDEARAEGRLALFEQQSLLPVEESEMAEYRGRDVVPCDGRRPTPRGVAPGVVRRVPRRPWHAETLGAHHQGLPPRPSQ